MNYRNSHIQTFYKNTHVRLQKYFLKIYDCQHVAFGLSKSFNTTMYCTLSTYSRAILWSEIQISGPRHSRRFLNLNRAPHRGVRVERQFVYRYNETSIFVPSFDFSALSRPQNFTIFRDSKNFGQYSPYQIIKTPQNFDIRLFERPRSMALIY